jgi:hypothetical protein
MMNAVKADFLLKLGLFLNVDGDGIVWVTDLGLV